MDRERPESRDDEIDRTGRDEQVTGHDIAEGDMSGLQAVGEAMTPRMEEGGEGEPGDADLASASSPGGGA